ncbi:unnamed protein product [Closterium sp. NIES-53]
MCWVILMGGKAQLISWRSPSSALHLLLLHWFLPRNPPPLLNQAEAADVAEVGYWHWRCKRHWRQQWQLRGARLFRAPTCDSAPLSRIYKGRCVCAGITTPHVSSRIMTSPRLASPRWNGASHHTRRCTTASGAAAGSVMIDCPQLCACVSCILTCRLPAQTLMLSFPPWHRSFPSFPALSLSESLTPHSPSQLPPSPPPPLTPSSLASFHSQLRIIICDRGITLLLFPPFPTPPTLSSSAPASTPTPAPWIPAIAARAHCSRATCS